MYPICMYMHAKLLQFCLTLQPYGLLPTRLIHPWGSPSKNTGVRCHTLLQGIFPTQGSDAHLLHLLHGQVGSSPLEPSEKSCTQYVLCCVVLSSSVMPDSATQWTGSVACHASLPMGIL